ncbi:MAG: Ni/Fe hydrogenase subunit alpha, partial [Ignavibacteria bacterium]|nr:Ni/Fe hydrogenase subunit alpha [Ignavibacteria bacterium]
VRVGGFYKLPTKKDLLSLVEKLKWARDAAIDTVKLVATFPFPEFEQDYEYVALRHPNEYPFNEGRLVSNKGLDIEIKDYEYHFAEEHVQHSNALHSVLKERGNYFVGPNARYNLNFDKLTSLCKETAKSVGLPSFIKNPFKSIIVRAVETLYAIEEALRIIEHYEMPEKPCVEIIPKEGIGYGCTEAPRGILFHRYRVDESGNILDAKIIPPTAQNFRTMESDLRNLVPKNLELDNEKLTWLCEQAIRNYDPCISCATHFLKLEIERN